MKSRCYNNRNNSYENYGGRGIKIYEEWLTNNVRFYTWALDNGYADELTIERINVNGNYEPSNCKWIPASEQGRNTRTSLGIEKAKEIKKLLSETNMTQKEIGNIFGVAPSTIGKIALGKNYGYI